MFKGARAFMKPYKQCVSCHLYRHRKVLTKLLGFFRHSFKYLLQNNPVALIISALQAVKVKPQIFYSDTTASPSRTASPYGVELLQWLINTLVLGFHFVIFLCLVSNRKVFVHSATRTLGPHNFLSLNFLSTKI